MNIEKGHVIHYKICEPYYEGNAVVIGVSDRNDTIFCVEVKRATEFTKCYDELGARYPEDKDNVRLKDCPPPFKQLSRGIDGGVYALADINNPIRLTKEQCEKYHVMLLDGGATISDRDMHEIFNHPWMDQKQKELKRSESIQKHNERIRDLDDKFGGIVNDTSEKDEIQR